LGDGGRAQNQSHVAWDWMQLWRAGDKVVYSRSVETVSSGKSRMERDFEPSAIGVMKNFLERDISIGGPDLAAQAFRAGLVDRCQLFLTPVLVGGGKPACPRWFDLTWTWSPSVASIAVLSSSTIAGDECRDASCAASDRAPSLRQRTIRGSNEATQS
jgi:hypothetical protein